MPREDAERIREELEEAPFRQTGWAGLRGRLFHLYFLLRRPMTLGVRAVIHDATSQSVFLIRHTYVPGWQLPGGGVERNEPLVEALEREVLEEGEIEILSPPQLVSMHFNRRSSPRDHVALYLVSAWRQNRPKRPDAEIAEAGFFPLHALPEGTTPATRRRLAEVFDAAPASAFW